MPIYGHIPFARCRLLVLSAVFGSSFLTAAYVKEDIEENGILASYGDKCFIILIFNLKYKQLVSLDNFASVTGL